MAEQEYRISGQTLTAAADAIREADGSVEGINPQDFSARIRAVAGTAVSQEGAASVGQVLKVAAVDENGKVTAVSAENMPVYTDLDEVSF